MAFCKICVCGEKIDSMDRGRFPGKCPKCGRDTYMYRSFNLDDADDRKALEEQLSVNNTAAEEKKTAEDNKEISRQVEERLSNKENKYILRLENGKDIEIPSGGCIIGRTEVGAEELAEFGSVSRKHIRITPNRRGVMIEDLSRYGTFIDGNKIPQNEPIRAFNGTKITLCNVDATLISEESET